MYNIGDIFYEDSEYAKRAEFCNQNNLAIKEVEPDANGRRYEIYDPFNNREHILSNLRERRGYECFSVINRGKIWYDTLTEGQLSDLRQWYRQWLDITNRYNDGVDVETIIPTSPAWLK